MISTTNVCLTGRSISGARNPKVTLREAGCRRMADEVCVSNNDFRVTDFLFLVLLHQSSFSIKPGRASFLRGFHEFAWGSTKERFLEKNPRGSNRFLFPC